MDAATFFGRLNILMRDNPPAAPDAPALARFAAVGIAPGTPFDLKSMDPAIAKGLERSVRVSQAQTVANGKRLQGTKVNGWQVITNMGSYGTDYLRRTTVALIGLGTNLPEDAIALHASVDADGQPLTGANQYVIRFPIENVGAKYPVTFVDANSDFLMGANS